MEYTVSMKVDGRVDVTVEASSFEEAFEKAGIKTFNPAKLDVVDYSPVNATDASGKMEDYNG